LNAASRGCARRQTVKERREKMRKLAAVVLSVVVAVLVGGCISIG